MSDCCIVGGGIIGLSLARELAGRGARVRVLSRDRSGDTASWAAAGIFPPVPPVLPTDPNAALTTWSDALHWRWSEDLQAETGIDNGLSRCGGLHLAATPARLAALPTAADDWRARGIRVDLLDGPAIAACEPSLAAAVARGGVLGGLLLPDEVQIRPPRHLAALEASCRLRGVEIIAADVSGFSRTGGRVSAVLCTAADGPREIRADHVVVAAGAWSARFAEAFGLSIETRPIRGQIALLRLPRQILGRVVNRGLDYLVPRADGRLLCGSTLEDAGFDQATVPAVIERLRGIATSLLGDLPGAVLERTWAGLRPGSVDGLPMIGPIPGTDNAFVAAGHFRAGLHQSTGTAVLLADLIEGRSPALDVAPFAVDRRMRPGGPDSVAHYLARAAAEVD